MCPSEAQSRSGSVCQCRCWAGSQSSLCWPGKSPSKSSEGAGSVRLGRSSPCPILTPSPPVLVRAGAGGPGQAAPLGGLSVTTALGLGGVLGLGLCTINQPVPITGGTTNTTGHCHLSSLLTLRCGGVRDAAESQLLRKIPEQSAEPGCTMGFSTSSADPDVCSRHPSGDPGLAVLSAAPGLLLKPSQPWLGLSEVIRAVIYPRLNLPVRECLRLGNLAGNIGRAAPAGFSATQALWLGEC